MEVEQLRKEVKLERQPVSGRREGARGCPAGGAAGGAGAGRSPFAPRRGCGGPGGGRGQRGSGGALRESPGCLGTAAACADGSRYPLWGRERWRRWRHRTPGPCGGGCRARGAGARRPRDEAPRGAGPGPPAAAAPVVFGTPWLPLPAGPRSPVPARGSLAGRGRSASSSVPLLSKTRRAVPVPGEGAVCRREAVLPRRNPSRPGRHPTAPGRAAGEAGRPGPPSPPAPLSASLAVRCPGGGRGAAGAEPRSLQPCPEKRCTFVMCTHCSFPRVK